MPIRISVELVPRSLDDVAAELEILRSDFPAVFMVNVPDLLRFDLRSWEACQQARRSVDRALPHLRAMDFSSKAAPDLARRLRDHGLSEALVVRGDAPQDLARPVHPTTSAELIRGLKQADPALRLYAAFDPYRQALRLELDAIQEKLEAGADGLFTQPLFDLRLMEVYADLLPETDVFWGVSPVLTASSRRYWEVKNRAVFPSSFQRTLDWNRSFAADCLRWAEDRDTGLYFMPIRVGLREYLGGVLGSAGT